MIARRQRAGFLAATAAVTRRHMPATAVLRCAPPRRSCYSTKPPCATSDNDHDLQQLEEEYAKLKVNWFPGHMVKATKVIKEKLKQASEASGNRELTVECEMPYDTYRLYGSRSKLALSVVY